MTSSRSWQKLSQSTQGGPLSRPNSLRTNWRHSSTASVLVEAGRQRQADEAPPTTCGKKVTAMLKEWRHGKGSSGSSQTIGRRRYSGNNNDDSCTAPWWCHDDKRWWRRSVMMRAILKWWRQDRGIHSPQRQNMVDAMPKRNFLSGKCDVNSHFPTFRGKRKREQPFSKNACQKPVRWQKD